MAVPKESLIGAEEQIVRAARIAELWAEHTTNEKGELLANVQESPAFQEVYDFKGADKKRWRLDRKKDWAYQQYDSVS